MIRYRLETQVQHPSTPNTRLLFKNSRAINLSIPLTILISSFLMSSYVFAHAQLKMEGSTPPRYDSPELKDTEPCGDEELHASLKTNRVSIFTSGETILVNWKETVNHSGLFYIDFSTTDINGPYNNMSTLSDTGATTSWDMSYTLPNETCTDCKLRLRQDMGNADISGHYFSCADVILVSGDDLIPPSATTNVATTVSGTDIEVNWTNPIDTDYKNTIVVRSTSTLNTAPEDRKDYLAADQVGNGVVVYKGNAEQFIDTGLSAMSSYIYTIFSYDNDYNYSTAVATSATTDQVNSGGGSSPDTNNNPDSNSEDSGALFGMLFLLATLIGMKRLQRRV